VLLQIAVNCKRWQCFLAGRQGRWWGLILLDEHPRTNPHSQRNNEQPHSRPSVLNEGVPLWVTPSWPRQLSMIAPGRPAATKRRLI